MLDEHELLRVVLVANQVISFRLHRRWLVDLADMDLFLLWVPTPWCRGSILRLWQKVVSHTWFNLVLFELLRYIFCFFITLYILLHEAFQFVLELFGQNPQGLLELRDLIFVCQHVSHDVVNKAASFAETTSEVHDSDSVLNTGLPGSPILTAILPGHLPVARFYIIDVSAPVFVAYTPGKLTFSMFKVVTVVTVVIRRILFCVVLFPKAFPVLQAIHEFSGVGAAVHPLVDTFTCGLTQSVLTDVAISTDKDISAVSVSQILNPLALVPISVYPGVHTVTVGLVVLPLADVRVTCFVPPRAISVLHAVQPFSIVNFATLRPPVNAFTLYFAISVVSFVRIAVRELFISFAMALIIDPFSLETPSRLVHNNALTFSLVRLWIDLAVVSAFFVCLYDKII